MSHSSGAVVMMCAAVRVLLVYDMNAVN
jgi:hypothetical protein